MVEGLVNNITAGNLDLCSSNMRFESRLLLNDRNAFMNQPIVGVDGLFIRRRISSDEVMNTRVKEGKTNQVIYDTVISGCGFVQRVKNLREVPDGIWLLEVNFNCDNNRE